MKKSYQYLTCFGAYLGAFLITFLPCLFGWKIAFYSEVNELITYLGLTGLILSLALIHFNISKGKLTPRKAILLLLLSYQTSVVLSRGIYGFSTYFFFIPISAGFFVSLFAYLYFDVVYERRREGIFGIEECKMDAIVGPREVFLSPSFAAILGTPKTKIRREEFENALLEKFTEVSSLKFLRRLSSFGSFLGVLVSEKGDYLFYGLAKFGKIAFIKLLEDPGFSATLGANKDRFLGFLILTDERISYASRELEEVLGKEIVGHRYEEIEKLGKRITSSMLLLPFPFPILLMRLGDYVLAYKAGGDAKMAITCNLMDNARRIGIFLLREGIVEYVTKGTLEILGLPENEIIGKPFWSFFSEKDRGTISSRIVDLRFGRARYIRRRAKLTTYVKELPVEIELMTNERHREYQLAILRGIEKEEVLSEEYKVLVDAMREMIPEISEMIGDRRYFSLVFTGLRYLLSFSEYEAFLNINTLIEDLSSELDIRCDVEEDYFTRMTERELGAIIILLSWVRRHSSTVSLLVKRGKIALRGALKVPGAMEVISKLEGEIVPSREQDLWVSLYFLKSHRKRFQVKTLGEDLLILEK